MKKEILSEINRFREITGLPLLVEGKIPTSFVEDLAKLFNKSTDELFTSIERKEIPSLEKTLKNAFGDDSVIFAKNLKRFKDGTLTPTLEDKLLASLIRSGDSKIKNLVETTFIKSNKDLNKIISRFTKRADGSYPEVQPGLSYDKYINRLSPDQYEEYVKLQNQIIDASDLGTQMKKYLKEKLTSDLTSIRTSSIKTLSVESSYNYYVLQAKKAGKKPLSMEELKKVEDDLIEAGITKDDLVKKMIELSGDETALWEKIRNVGKTKKEFENIAGDSVEALKKNSKGWSFWQILGIAAVIGLPIAWYTGGLETAYYGSLSDTWKEIYKNSFIDLPKDLQSKIVSTYNADQATTDSSKPKGIKSFDWDEENETLFVNFFDGSKDTWKKMQTGDQTYWGKEGDKKENELEKETLKTEEEFKAAAMKGGFDVGKSFVKQTDTKYWGVDNDTTESTTEWNGTTFIVTSGHI